MNHSLAYSRDEMYQISMFGEQELKAQILCYFSILYYLNRFSCMNYVAKIRNFILLWKNVAARGNPPQDCPFHYKDMKK